MKATDSARVRFVGLLWPVVLRVINTQTTEVNPPAFRGTAQNPPLTRGYTIHDVYEYRTKQCNMPMGERVGRGGGGVQSQSASSREMKSKQQTTRECVFFHHPGDQAYTAGDYVHRYSSKHRRG